jgi:hypothetical protein
MTKAEQLWAIKDLSNIIVDIICTGKKLNEEDANTTILCEYMEKFTYGWHVWQDDLERQILDILEFQSFIINRDAQ